MKILLLSLRLRLRSSLRQRGKTSLSAYPALALGSLPLAFGPCGYYLPRLMALLSQD